MWTPKKFTSFDSLFVDCLMTIVTYFRWNECEIKDVLEDYEFVKKMNGKNLQILLSFNRVIISYSNAKVFLKRTLKTYINMKKMCFISIW